MTTTADIPTPPPWLTLEIEPSLRTRVFELAGQLRSASGVGPDVLEEARATLRSVAAAEDAMYAQVNAEETMWPQAVADAVLMICSQYCGSQVLHNALMDYVKAHRELEDGRYDPDMFMRPAEIAADT